MLGSALRAAVGAAARSRCGAAAAALTPLARSPAPAGARGLAAAATEDVYEGWVGGLPVQIYNPGGKKRVVVTKPLPGERYLEVLTTAGCRVEVCRASVPILSVPQVKTLISDKCDGIIGQLTEDWSDELFEALRQAGGTAFSNYAVGYNNVKVPSATERGIPVGNTPGVLTETTAELASALVLAAARRVTEADHFMRRGDYKGWLPTLFVGNLLQRKTLGVIGAGRIGFALARQMCEGHKMDLLYYDLKPQPKLEEYFERYNEFLERSGQPKLVVRRAESADEVFAASDVVSMHCVMDESTRHMVNERTLGLMKPNATLVNTARGEVVDEPALVRHLKNNKEFRCGLDVYEQEPAMADGLAECKNAVIVPHIASSSLFTRGGMATIAAANVAARVRGLPVWNDQQNVAPFLDGEVEEIPQASPSIVNAAELGLPVVESGKVETTA